MVIFLKHIYIILLPAIIVAGCNKTIEKENDEELTSLKGTKWKLECIVDDETKTLNVIEPKDCEKCYTLIFDTDSTADGYSAANIVHLINLDPFRIQCATYIAECDCNDGNFYCGLLLLAKSYEANSNKLKLFFADKNHYLLFKRI